MARLVEDLKYHAPSTGYSTDTGDYDLTLSYMTTKKADE